jgi:maltose O-acetyltransferase
MSVVDKIKHFSFVKLRVLKYRWLSNCEQLIGKPICNQPLLLNGKGSITFGTNCKFGYKDSASFYSTYSYLEARTTAAKIIFGDNNYFNNNCTIEAIESIEFGNDILVGVNCSFSDNDGHNLQIDKRKSGIPNSSFIKIEDNVFIGDNVTVLKGVTIGKNSVIGNSSVVTKSIPANSIAVGNPAKVIKTIL